MSRRIRVGLVLPMFSGSIDKVLAAAREAEDLGFDGVFAFDHFFPPGGAPDRPSLEAFATLGVVAAATRRVRLGTLVIRAVLRPPGMVAKMAATLDDMSGGRMILGLGTGDPIDRPEHDAYGFPNLSVADRRAHLVEAVEAMQALFEGRKFEGGTHVPAMAGPLAPPPGRSGGPPIWIGAQGDEVVRLSARMADGWNGWGFPPERFRPKADLLAKEAATAGRTVEATWAGIALVGEDDREVDSLLEARHRRKMPDALAFSGSAPAFAAFLDDLAGAGATWAIVVAAGPADRRRLIGERVLQALER